MPPTTAPTPPRTESSKVKWDLLPYIQGAGLDIGCGAEKVFPHCIGIDGAGAAGANLEMSCDRLGAFADGAFDFVFSAHALGAARDPKAVLAEWWRVLKPGGHLLLYLPHRDLCQHVGEPTSHLFAPGDITALMQGLGDWDLLENQVRDQGDEHSFFQAYRRGAPGSGQRFSCEAPPAFNTCGVLCVGGVSDAMWLSSTLPHLKAAGHHVTVYAQERCAEVLTHDPHIDVLIALDSRWTERHEDSRAFLAHMARKHARWIRFTGVVRRLLPVDGDFAFEWSHGERLRECGGNYLTAMHDFAELPRDYRQKFYPSANETAWAADMRSKIAGPIVVIAGGLTAPEFWPHFHRCAILLAERGVTSVLVGDTRGAKVQQHDLIINIGEAWPIRRALAFAQIADAVIGEDTGVLNAAAMEPMLKVVLLSSSSPENLTSHWRNTVALSPPGLACHPCHRQHRTMEYCTPDTETGAAACQALIAPERVAGVVLERLHVTDMPTPPRPDHGGGAAAHVPRLRVVGGTARA